MSSFLTTSGCIALLEDIIRKAKTELYLISPYIRLDNNFYERLKYASDKGVNIHVVFGKEELLADARDFFAGLDRTTIYYHKHLHAKCYYNEGSMLLTSMNLYVKSSRDQNREMGITISKTSNPALYEEAAEEVRSIISASEVVKSQQTNSTKIEKIPEDVPATVKERPPAGEVHGIVYDALVDGTDLLQIRCESVERRAKSSKSVYQLLVTAPSGQEFHFEHRLRIPFAHWSDPTKKALRKHLADFDKGGRLYSSNSSSLKVYLPKSARLQTAEEKRWAAAFFLEYFWEAYRFLQST